MSLIETQQRYIIPQKNIYYARVEGNDGNDGKSIEYAKATAQALATAAINNTPPPSGTNRVSAEIVDGADYEKFSLSTGGFVSFIAPYSSFGVTTTSTSPEGIIIADGYAVQLGFIRHLLAGSGDQAGILVKCGAGANATHVDIRQIFNSTIYDDVLLQSEGNAVFAEIEDLRQGNNRDSTAIYVLSGFLYLCGNHRMIGKLTVGVGAKAIINTAYFDGDVATETNAELWLNAGYWHGDRVTAGAGSKFHPNVTTWELP